MQLLLGLKKIEALEKDIRNFKELNSVDADSSTPKIIDNEKKKKTNAKKVEEFKKRVEDLVRGSVASKDEADGILAGLASFSSSLGISSLTTTTPSAGLDEDVGRLNEQLAGLQSSSSALPSLWEEEMKSAVAFFTTLSTPVKDTLAKAAGYKDGYSSVSNVQELVQKLYETDGTTSMATLRRLYFESFTKHLPPGTNVILADETGEEYALLSLNELIENMKENKTMAMELFPRNFQDAEEDAQTVFQLLDQTTFMATEKPLRVNGGYLIRGLNKRKSASEMLDAIDAKLAKASPQWTEKYQLNFVEYTTDTPTELSELALLLTPNVFAPTAPVALSVFSTSVAFFLSFLYCINTFAGNDAVMERLKEASELAGNGGLYDISWFNELLVPLLVTLGAAQGVHELLHLLVAGWNKVSQWL